MFVGGARQAHDLRWNSCSPTSGNIGKANIKITLSGGHYNLEVSFTEESDLNTAYWDMFSCSMSDFESITLVNVRQVGQSVSFSRAYNLKTVDLSGSPNIVLKDSMFSGAFSLTTISLPSGITSFPASIFYGCSGLRSLAFPTTGDLLSITSIGPNAFYHCGIQSFPFDRTRNLESIGSSAFEDSSIKEVDLRTIRPTTFELGSRAFAKCSALTKFFSPGGQRYSKIPDSLFEGCTNLKTVDDGFSHVTSVGSKAFYQCSSWTFQFTAFVLTSIGVSAFEGAGFKMFDVREGSPPIEISRRAFASCASLATVNLPEGVTSLPDSVFEGCLALPAVPGIQSLTSIGANAFFGCSGLAVALTAPKDLTTIGESAFEGSAITSFDATQVSSSLEIGMKAFASCTGLVSVTFSPQTAANFPESVFEGCTSLSSMASLPSLTSIGTKAFFGCSSLAVAFTAPDSLTTIGNSAFEGSAITSFDATQVSSSLEIGMKAFASCTGLVSVTFSPQTATSFSESVFEGCTSLSSMASLPSLTSIGTRAFFGCSALAVAFTAPDSLTTIGESAFEGSAITSFDATHVGQTLTLNFKSFRLCAGLESVKFSPQTATDFPGNIFEECAKLNSMELPSLQSIGSRAFWKCSALAITFTASGSLTSISERAFEECGITSFDASQASSSLELGVKAFFACTSLESIQFSSQMTTNFPESVFEGCTSLNSVTDLPSFTSIGTRAFFGCSSLAQTKRMALTLPASLMSVGASAFEESGITSFDASQATSPLDLGQRAFFSCSALTTVQLSSATTTLGESVFEGCVKLERIPELPSLQNIGTRAFFGCSALTGEFKAPESLVSIGELAFGGSAITSANLEAAQGDVFQPRAFSQCLQLTEFVFPNHISVLPEELFSESGFVSITIPATIQDIGSGCFDDCKSLRTVTYLGTTQIDNYLFGWCDSLETVYVPNDYPSDFFGGKYVTKADPSGDSSSSGGDSGDLDPPDPVPGGSSSNGSSNGTTIGIAVGVSLAVVVIVVVVLLVLWRLGKIGGKKKEEPEEHNLVSV